MQRPATLVASRLRYLKLFVLSCGFVAAGLWASQQTGNPKAQLWGPIGAAIFGVFAVLALIGLAAPVRLSLDDEGFTVATPWRATRTAWQDVERFVLIRIRSAKLVGWTYRPGRRPAGKLRPANRRIGTIDAALPTTLGLSAEQLLRTMNDRLRAAMTRV